MNQLDVHPHTDCAIKGYLHDAPHGYCAVDKANEALTNAAHRHAARPICRAGRKSEAQADEGKPPEIDAYSPIGKRQRLHVSHTGHLQLESRNYRLVPFKRIN